jgi:FAD:protein FMN transferase
MNVHRIDMGDLALRMPRPLAQVFAALTPARPRCGWSAIAVLGVVSLLGTVCAAQAGEERGARRFAFAERHMGVEIKLTFYAAEDAVANRAAQAAFARFAELDRTLSDYQTDSELSRFSASSASGEWVALGPDLWTVLAHAQALSRRSGGAFDVTVGPLVKLWRRARRQREMPSDMRLSEARAVVGYQLLELDAARRSGRLMRPGMRLDLGGIAMGYAADEALAVLRERGISRALVDASGDIVAGDPPPGEIGWRVGLPPAADASAPPEQFLALANAAITASGDAFQFVELDGRRYSHIVDPHTGLGLTDRTTVTIVAPTCIVADSLATAVAVLGPGRGAALVDKTPGASLRIVRLSGETPEVITSAGFADLPQAPTAR